MLREAHDPVLERIREALRGLAFGTITVTVQDGVVVQIDRTEKLRLDRAAPPFGGAAGQERVPPGDRARR